MKRDDIIERIESTFPADSAYHATARIGQRLLTQAKNDIEDWRNLPIEILQRYANLCDDEIRQQERNAARNAAYYHFEGEAG